MNHCQPNGRALVYSWLDRVSGALFAPRCLLCDGHGQSPCLDLCVACERGLPRMPERCCIRCGLPAETAGAPGECAACREMPPPYACCRAALRYADPVDGLVKRLKYRGQLVVARVLGELLASRAIGPAPRNPETAVHLLLPVPLHPSRLSERGFNQSLEIARWSARRLCLPLAPGLAVRVRATAPQAGLSSGDRRANLRDAFLAGTAVRGLNIGLVDDVVTTGSTVTALSAALLDAGAASVSVFCVARAVESAQGQPTPSGAGVRLVAPKDRPGCA